jgi:hypothetical protein
MEFAIGVLAALVVDKLISSKYTISIKKKKKKGEE